MIQIISIAINKIPYESQNSDFFAVQFKFNILFGQNR